MVLKRRTDVEPIPRGLITGIKHRSLENRTFRESLFRSKKNSIRSTEWIRCQLKRKKERRRKKIVSREYLVVEMMTKRERRSVSAGRRRWLVTEVANRASTKSTALRRKLVSFPFQKAGCKNISSWRKQLEEHFFRGNRLFVYPIRAQGSFRNFPVSTLRITRGV